MTKQVSKELINSWEWLDAFCLTQRGICELACGQHAIVVVQINQFEEIKEKLTRSQLNELLQKIEKQMETYALEDTIVAKYNEYTYVVVLHYLNSRDEIEEICNEIEASFSEDKEISKYNVSVTLGAAECHHDPDSGYKCAARLAMEALQEAKEKNKEFILAPDTLRPHPLALKMKEARRK